MSRINRSYSKEFIKEFVNYALNAVSISFAVKELGIPEATLHGWIKKLVLMAKIMLLQKKL